MGVLRSVDGKPLGSFSSIDIFAPYKQNSPKFLLFLVLTLVQWFILYCSQIMTQDGTEICPQRQMKCDHLFI